MSRESRLCPYLLEERTVALVKEMMRRSAKRMGVTNLMCWLIDSNGTHLEARMGVGTQASMFEDRYSQPLEEGLISAVFSTGQSLCQNHVADHPEHSELLDAMLSQQTESMVAVPLVIQGATVGVMSVVRLADEPAAPGAHGFTEKDLEEMEFLAACAARMIGADESMERDHG